MKRVNPELKHRPVSHANLLLIVCSAPRQLLPSPVFIRKPRPLTITRHRERCTASSQPASFSFPCRTSSEPSNPTAPFSSPPTLLAVRVPVMRAGAPGVVKSTHVARESSCRMGGRASRSERKEGANHSTEWAIDTTAYGDRGRAKRERAMVSLLFFVCLIRLEGNSWQGREVSVEKRGKSWKRWRLGKEANFTGRSHN